MRVFKNNWFARFARQEGISDEDLCDAIRRAENGQIDADLGGGVIKQRIAREDQGSSGGFRSIIYYRVADSAYFVFGFPKSKQANIKQNELKAFKKLAKIFLGYTEKEVEHALKTGVLVEVKYDAQTKNLQK